MDEPIFKIVIHVYDGYYTMDSTGTIDDTLRIISELFNDAVEFIDRYFQNEIETLISDITTNHDQDSL